MDDIERPLATLASWLRTRLADLGVHLGAAEWFDYEFQLPYEVEGKTYPVSVSYDFGRLEWFEIYFPTDKGLISRLRGGRHVKELSMLSQSINTALASREGVREIRWYRDFPTNPDRHFTRTPQ